MNENFIRCFETSGLTMYELAKKTGLPYTTINELKRGVLDINKCSAGHILQLAELFHVSIEDLMNPYSYMEGVSDKYRGVRYTWVKEKTMVLSCKYKKQSVVLDSGLQMNVPGRREAYNLMGELMIDRYLKKLEFEKAAEKLIKEHESGRAVSFSA